MGSKNEHIYPTNITDYVNGGGLFSEYVKNKEVKKSMLSLI